MTLLLTGLTRDGVFLVESGEVVGAVNNFRFNMSPLDMLRQAAEVGAHRADAVPGMERLVHPHGDAADPRGRVQHVVGVARDLTPAGAARREGAARICARAAAPGPEDLASHRWWHPG